MEDEKTSKSKKRFIDVFPLCHKSCQRYIIYTLWLILILLLIYQYYLYRSDFRQWDLLLLTGVLAFILGLPLAADVRNRFELTLSRLQIREVLKIGEEEKNKFFDRREKNAQNWARIGGIMAAVAMIGAFVVVLLQEFLWQQALLGIAEALGAYIAGTHLGRMASYGQLGWQLEKESVKIEVQPLHFDGVAGLKPVGDFFFYQAMIAAIPAIFLAAWWFLFPIWPRDYSHWEQAYLALLSIAILIEILAFLVPIWSFHRIMHSEKTKWLEKADRLSNEISEIQCVSESGQPLGMKNIQPEQIEEMRKLYWAIENMATWPVDIKTKRRFELNNVLLFIPFLGDIAKRSLVWKDILAILKQLGLLG